MDDHDYPLSDDKTGGVIGFVAGVVFTIFIVVMIGIDVTEPTHEYIGPPPIPQERINHACGKDKISKITASANEFNVNGDDAYWTVTCDNGSTKIVGRKLTK